MSKKEISTGECVHYWVIETPEGPTSTGRCKFCGLTKEFNNTWADSFNEHQLVGSGMGKTRKETAKSGV